MKKQAKAKKVLRTKVSSPKNKVQEARRLHDRGVLVRGEAAPAGKDGKLPLPYTHEIVGGKLVRRRFSVT